MITGAIIGIVGMLIGGFLVALGVAMGQNKEKA